MYAHSGDPPFQYASETDLPTQRETKVEDRRNKDDKEMLKTTYDHSRSGGIWLFGFPSYTPFTQPYGRRGISPVTAISKVGFPPACDPKRGVQWLVPRSPEV